MPVLLFKCLAQVGRQDQEEDGADFDQNGFVRVPSGVASSAGGIGVVGTDRCRSAIDTEGRGGVPHQTCVERPPIIVVAAVARAAAITILIFSSVFAVALLCHHVNYARTSPTDQKCWVMFASAPQIWWRSSTWC